MRAQTDPHAELIGTCPDMCPEYERHERELHLDLSPFEMIPGTERPAQPGDYPRISHLRAVKKYHRPAAGNDAALPGDVRPPAVLAATMDYLIDEILAKSLGDSSLLAAYQFVRDRSRAIRQDFTLQHRTTHLDWLNVKIHQEIARFHLSLGHRLCESEPGEYDAFQNSEQLKKVLQSLLEIYTDTRKALPSNPAIGRNLKDEIEFRSYHLATHIADPTILRQALEFPAREDLLFQTAIATATAFHQRDYFRFFEILADLRPINRQDAIKYYLFGCALQPSFALMRRRALTVIAKGFSPNEPLAIAQIQSWLGCEDLEEARDYLAAAGFRIEGTICYLSPSEPLIGSVKARKNYRLIERFVSGISLAEIIRNDPTDVPFDANGNIPTNVAPANQNIPTNVVPLQVKPCLKVSIPQKEILQKHIALQVDPQKSQSIIQSSLPIEQPKRPTVDLTFYAKCMYSELSYIISREILQRIASETICFTHQRKQIASVAAKTIFQSILQDSIQSQVAKVAIDSFRSSQNARNEMMNSASKDLFNSLMDAWITELIVPLSTESIRMSWLSKVKSSTHIPNTDNTELIYEEAAMKVTFPKMHKQLKNGKSIPNSRKSELFRLLNKEKQESAAFEELLQRLLNE